MTPERRQILSRASDRLAAIGRDWDWLTKELNESPQTMNHWRHHRGIPSAKLPAVATLLGWSVEQLLGRDSASEWPFRTIPPHRLSQLSEGELMQVEGVLLDKLRDLEGSQEKQRRAVTERTGHNNAKPGRDRKTAP